jgi:hypothetical protein
MKAGRELDALIAEKVMGWKPRQSKHGYWNLDGPNGEHFTDIDRRDYTAQYDKETGQKVQQAPWWEYFWDEIPFYSTNIADAWEVVEKLGRWRGFDFMLVMPNPEQTFHLHTYEAGWYEATNDGPERRVVSDADTAPLAICIAALKAVSQEGQG